MNNKILQLYKIQEKLLILAAKFDESQVNRDKSGKFAPKKGSTDSTKKEDKRNRFQKGVDYIKQHPGQAALASAGIVGLGVGGAKLLRKKGAISTKPQFKNIKSPAKNNVDVPDVPDVVSAKNNVDVPDVVSAKNNVDVPDAAPARDTAQIQKEQDLLMRKMRGITAKRKAIQEQKDAMERTIKVLTDDIAAFEATKRAKLQVGFASKTAIQGYEEIISMNKFFLEQHRAKYAKLVEKDKRLKEQSRQLQKR